MVKNNKAKRKSKNKKKLINLKSSEDNLINSNNKMMKLNIDNDYIKNNKIHLNP